MVASLPVALFSLAHWNKIHIKLKCNRTPIKGRSFESPVHVLHGLEKSVRLGKVSVQLNN